MRDAIKLLCNVAYGLCCVLNEYEYKKECCAILIYIPLCIICFKNFTENICMEMYCIIQIGFICVFIICIFSV